MTFSSNVAMVWEFGVPSKSIANAMIIIWYILGKVPMTIANDTIGKQIRVKYVKIRHHCVSR